MTCAQTWMDLHEVEKMTFWNLKDLAEATGIRYSILREAAYSTCPNIRKISDRECVLLMNKARDILDDREMAYRTRAAQCAEELTRIESFLEAGMT